MTTVSDALSCLSSLDTPTSSDNNFDNGSLVTIGMSSPLLQLKGKNAVVLGSHPEGLLFVRSLRFLPVGISGRYHFVLPAHLQPTFLPLIYEEDAFDHSDEPDPSAYDPADELLPFLSDNPSLFLPLEVWSGLEGWLAPNTGLFTVGRLLWTVPSLSMVDSLECEWLLESIRNPSLWLFLLEWRNRPPSSPQSCTSCGDLLTVSDLTPLSDPAILDTVRSMPSFSRQ